MKKRGRKIRQSLVVLPNGFRLWVLAEISRRTGAKGHYLTHADSLERLIDAVHSGKGNVTDMEAAGIEASSKVLLEYIKCVSNVDIARASLKGA